MEKKAVSCYHIDVMQDVFLSVIVPVYNAGEYLKECLDSLFAQTFRDMEIILVDDGSTDGSGEVCDAYAAEYPGVCVIHKKNGGPASAKREGIKAARGEYIGFADSDDRMDADYYERLVNHAKQSGAEIVTCGRHDGETGRIKTDRLPEGVYRGERLEKLRRHLLYSDRYEAEAVMPNVYTKLYKKDLIFPFLSILPDGLYLWEDLCYVYAPFMNASCVRITYDGGYHYRHNASSVSHRTDPEKWRKVLYTLETAKDIYAQFAPEVQTAFCVRSAYIFHHHLWGSCLKRKEGTEKVKDAAEQLEKRTASSVFREVTDVALQSGRIRNRHIRFFLGSLRKGRYAAAVRYCRAVVFASRMKGAVKQ